MKNVKNVSLMKNVQYIILSALLMVCGNAMGETVTTDVLTISDISSSATNQTYADFTATKTAASYSGQTAKDHDAIQIRSKNGTSGIVSTTSGGKIKSVSVTWEANTASGRTLNVYGSHSALTISDLYSETSVGTIVYGTSTEYVFTSDYEYVGVRSNDGAMYLTNISFTWTDGQDCQKSIELSKGTPQNGTFTITEPLGEYCVDAGALIVHITDITPVNSNYVATAITATNGTPSDIVNGEGTVSNITDNTEINVTFSPKTAAALYLSALGNKSNTPKVSGYVGDTYTFTSEDVPSQGRTGHVFYGWSDKEFSESEYSTTAPTIYRAGDTYTLKSNDDVLYAVYAEQEGTAVISWSDFTSDNTMSECTFVIAANVNGTYYAMKNNFGAQKYNAYEIVSLTDGHLLTNQVADYAVTFEKTSYGATYKIKSNSLASNQYLHGKANDTELGKGTATDNYNMWQVSTGTNGTYNIANYNLNSQSQLVSNDNRRLICSTTNTRFADYASSNGTSQFDCEIIPVGSGYTYSGFATRFITYQNFAYKCTYDITYTLGDGHAWIDESAITKTYDHNKNGEAIALPTGDNLADGQYFRGWYDNKNLEGYPITTLAVTGNGDKSVFAKWADVVNFYVQGAIAETQTIDNEGKVDGYTPAATCPGKKFMGWSTTNIEGLVQEAPADLFTDFSDKEFSASTGLYAVYAAYNGGKIIGNSTIVDNVKDISNFIGQGTNATYVLENASLKLDPKCYRLTAKTESEIPTIGSVTTSLIKDLKQIEFDYKTTGKCTLKVEISADGETWTEVRHQIVSETSVLTTFVAELTQYGDYQVRIKASHTTKTASFADIITFRYIVANRSYWYSDYSTSCDMATSAAINYTLGIEEQQYTKVSGENVGATISITDRAPQGYHMYSLEIEGQTYNLGDSYILAHDVLATNVDIRPVITWTERYNNPAQWTQTTAPNENGNLVLPTTQPASFAPGLYEFDGWTATVFDTDYKTTAPTYVTAETDAPAAPTTYYAVYRKQNNTGEGYTYRQTIPSSLYKLTYSPNGGVGEDYVTYTDLSTATTPASNLFTREGATLVGWTLDPNAETIEYVGTSTQITGIEGDRHYYAVWIGELAMNKTIALTSASGATVGSATFTLSSKNLGTITALRFSYKDVDNNITYNGTSGETARTKSEFRLCNESYTLAEDNLDVSTISTNFSKTYTITYAPNSGHKMSHYKLVVELLNKNKVMTTQEFDLLGRALPDQFVIATQKDGKWYALQANMTSSKGWAGVPINVEDGLAFASDTLLYSLKTYSNDKTHVLFQSAYKQGHLWAASGAETGIRNYANTISGESNPYAWLIETTDMSAYTIRNKQDKPDHQYLGMNGTNFGMYQLNTPMQFYFLPIGADELEISLGEWYSNKLLFGEPEKLTDISVKLNGVSQDEHISVSRKTYSDTYNLYELSGINFAEAAGQTMFMKMSTESNTYYNNITVPTFVTTDVDASTIAANADVVVRDGGQLTLTDDATFGTLTICPSGVVTVPAEKTLTVDSLVLFGGIEDADRYGIPQLVLHGTLVSKADSILYRMRVDAEQMYTVSFPYNVQVKDITRPDGLAIRDGEKVWTGSLWMSTYNGENRAKGGRRDNSETNSWKQDAALGATLQAGVGYTVSAPRLRDKSKYAYSLIDFPMLIPTTNEEAEYATIEAELSTSKGNASVIAYKQEGANNRTDWGWNLLANPYMSTISGGDYKLKVGDDTYDVVTMLTDDGEGYYQFKYEAGSEGLRPFKHFFLQIGESGTFCIQPNLSTAPAPRYLAAVEEGRADFALTLTNAEANDRTYIQLNKRFTDEYEIGADVVKMCSAQTQLYSLFGEEGLFRIATAAENDNKFIPLGYHTAMSGSFTFAMAANAAINNVDHIYLLENGEAVADLLRDSYTFETPAGTNNDRFAIFVVMKGGQAPTSIFGTSDDGGGGPQKIIHHSMMYIVMPDGRVYNAAGDQVHGKEVTK